MRSVKSRVLFEQMKGRGVRVINDDRLPGRHARRAGEGPLRHRRLRRRHRATTRPTRSRWRRSLRLVRQAARARRRQGDQGRLPLVARRPHRPHRPADRATRSARRSPTLAGGFDAQADRPLHRDRPRSRPTSSTKPGASAGLAGRRPTPTGAQIARAAKLLLGDAVAPLRRGVTCSATRLANATKTLEQTIDQTSIDTLLVARSAPEIKQRIAAKVVQGFESFLVEHKDEITALQVLYSRPYKHRLTARRT